MPTTIDPARLHETLEQAREFVLRHVGDDGRILSPGHAGPPSTAYVLLTFHFVGATGIDVASAAGFVAWRQLPSGAFRNYPHDPSGDPWSTALGLQALRVSDPVTHADAIARAEAWLAENQGDAPISDGLYRLNINPLYVALGGGFDPGELPDLSAVKALLVREVWDAAAKHTNVAFLWMGLALWAIIRRLQDPEAAAHPGFIESAERARILEILAEFQNDNGSFNATVFQTTLAAAALHSLGLEPTDGPLWMALEWLRHAQERVHPDKYSAWRGFNTGIWSTSLSLRALLAGGFSRRDPRINAAVRWLTRVQITQELPELQPSKPGTPRHGGWPFETMNQTVPDADDTAVALGALGMALQANGDDRLSPHTESLARVSVARGLDFLLGMQNDDGGWPAFQWGLPTKPAGPFLVEYPHFGRGHTISEIRTTLQSLLIFGDPATSDITARTLFGLAQLGFDHNAPVVQRALAFLESQQCTPEQVSSPVDGAPWWSRWITNYLSCTSYVLGGIAAVGGDLSSPSVQGAIAWTKAAQNDDGGWGETVFSYQDPSQAGKGDSMPITTALVLCGLMQSGEGDSEVVRRGIQYLLDAADGSGQWADEGMLHVFYRTDTFYRFGLAQAYYPLEALGRYAQLLAGAPTIATADVSDASLARTRGLAYGSTPPLPPVRDASGAWSRAGLHARSRVGDRPADRVIEAIFEAHDVGSVGRLFGQIARNDDPIPSGMPEVVMDFFEQTAALPRWADPAQLSVAEQVFARMGVATGIGLFNAALPQVYADPAIARVLMGTRGLKDAPQRRILETAQFIFDVAQPGAFGAGGRGVRAAQKVRLLHATIRHLTARKATWNPGWGVPISQEDEALTLLSFSVVLLSAWEKMGYDLDDHERDAWVHLWAVVGALMGIEQALLPTTFADASALWDVLVADRRGPSEAGRELTAALLEVSARYVPHWHGVDLSSALIRHLSGDGCADLLGVPQARWEERLLSVVSWLRGGEDPLHSPLFHGELRRISTEMVKGLIGAMRGGKQAAFRIPPSLIHAWDLQD